MTYQVTIKTPNKTVYHQCESESLREAVRWITIPDNASLIKIESKEHFDNNK